MLGKAERLTREGLYPSHTGCNVSVFSPVTLVLGGNREPRPQGGGGTGAVWWAAHGH